MRSPGEKKTGASYFRGSNNLFNGRKNIYIYGGMFMTTFEIIALVIKFVGVACVIAFAFYVYDDIKGALMSDKSDKEIAELKRANEDLRKELDTLAEAWEKAFEQFYETEYVPLCEAVEMYGIVVND